MTAKVFIDYAKYYDTLYQDKDYKAETDYVVSFFKNSDSKSAGSILELGCGTGKHALCFAQKG